MKAALLSAATLAAALTLTASSALAETTIRASVDFEAPLAPYGQWVVVRGARVFRPAVGVVGRDFVPYGTRGHWVSTEAGWSFQSDLPFAWATYHYGRWWYDDALGWVWYPDTTWGVSWVEWRYGGGYAGWAPLPPAVYVSTHRPRWVFVDEPRFCVSDPGCIASPKRARPLRSPRLRPRPWCATGTSCSRVRPWKRSDASRTSRARTSSHRRPAA